MFILNSLNQLEKAVTKARTVKPIVRIIKFGVYSVKGSKGNFYTVKCEKVGNDKVVTCECKGAERGLVCFHSASVLELHCTLAKHKATV
jgi:ribosomal protein S27E